MARINIEDCWWTDPRRERLGQLIGSMMMADAVVIRAWRTAQEFWGRGRGLVPKHVFVTLQDHPSLVQAGLAEEREDGFYVRGSSAYLDWINESREFGSVGGKISAQRKRDEKGRLLPKHPRVIQDPLDAEPSQSKPIQASSSSSSSLSTSKKTKKKKISDSDPSVDVVGTTIAHYCELWKARYHGNPPIGGKVAGQMRTLVRDYGETKAREYIDAYLSMPDSWFVERRHSIDTMLTSINKVVHFMATGKVITKHQIKTLEERVDSTQGTEPRPPSITEILRNKAALAAGGER